MFDVNEYIKRAAHRSGYKRESYIERNMPTQPSNVVAVPFYGDLRSLFVFSSFILKNYKEANKDKYLILCSWPGMQGLFPYVDEYWSIEDESVTKTLATEANNSYNTSSLATDLTRGLIEVLSVATARDFKVYYDDGFTQKYLDAFGGIKRFLPEVPSATKISNDFRLQMERKPGQKIVVYPATKMRSRQQGQTVYLPILKEFWVALIERLLAEGYVPVVYQNWFTYDMSRDFVDRCVYLVPRSVLDVLAAFRHIGFVLDVHTGISKLALAARCPFLTVTERQSFVEDKDYEIDDLCGEGLPHQYLFSFSTMLMQGGQSEWNVCLLDQIIVRPKEFLPTLKGATLPSTNESYELTSYEKVRQRKARRMGVTFINSSKNK